MQYLFNSLMNSYLQVTVHVGLSLFLISLLDYKLSGKITYILEKKKHVGPILGAFFGVLPGCGGAIFLMPLYLKGKISFGTIVATLIATMGDSAFVLISVSFKTYAVVSVISFITAIATGYIIDRYLNTRNIRIVGNRYKEKTNKLLNQSEDEHNINFSHEYKKDDAISDNFKHINHNEGDEVDIALHHILKSKHSHKKSLSYYITHKMHILFWLLLCISYVFGIMLLLNMNLPSISYYIGVVGGVTCVIFMLASKKTVSADSHEISEIKKTSISELLIHTAEEVAFVGFWVFIAYFAYDLVILLVGKGDYLIGENILTQSMVKVGIFSVISGALTGLIPGCGPQVIYVTLYSKGILPFSALIANAISQDGDALIPILILDKKSAIYITIITTIPALVVGFIMFYVFNI